MFVCKLRTLSCSHYDHFHVYLANQYKTNRKCGDPTNKPAHCTHFKGCWCISRSGLVQENRLTMHTYYTSK